MTIVLTIAAVLLLLNLTLGIVRVALSTEVLDRVSAGQLVGTLAAGILLILAQLQREPTLLLVALVLALPGAMTVVALRRTGWRNTRPPPQAQTTAPDSDAGASTDTAGGSR